MFTLEELQYKITPRRKDNGWQIVVNYKDPFTNKWRPTSKQGFKTKGAAQRYGDVLLDNLKQRLRQELADAGKPSCKYEDMTFKEFSALYIKSEKTQFTVGTRRTYTNAIQKLPSLLEKRINEITSDDLRQAFNACLPLYQPSTINLAMEKVEQIFKGAVALHVIAENPMDAIEHIPDRRDTKVKALETAEFKRLLEYMEEADYTFYVICALAGYTGLRWGEIAGLCWDRINFEKRTLRVDRQWGEITDDGLYGFKAPKSKNSYRTIPYPEALQKILMVYQKQWPRNTYNRLFGYLDQSVNVNREIKKVFPDKSIHKLRHTYGTYLTSTNKFSIQEIAALMGDSVQTVLKTYFHVTDDMRHKAQDKMDDIFNF